MLRKKVAAAGQSGIPAFWERP